MPHTPANAAIIARRLRLATGFLASERGWVSDRLTALGLPLRSYRDDQIELEISLKDRQGPEQRLALECWIDHRPRLHLVATSSERDLPTALSEVCIELIRQIYEARTRTDPRSNRALRLVPGLPKHE
jgi:ribosome-associated translation inhibitor RaiA